MNLKLRQTTDKIFTFSSGFAVVLMVLALILILGPIFKKGSTAVFFEGTNEFRKMQYNLFHRGDPQKIKAEQFKIDRARKTALDIYLKFAAGLDTESLYKQTKKIYRKYKIQLNNRVEANQLTKKQARKLKKIAKKTRNKILEALESENKNQALDAIIAAENLANNKNFKHTAAAEYAKISGIYKNVVKTVDLKKRKEYAKSLTKVKEILRRLFGPLPGEELPAVQFEQYGATRWDMAKIELDSLLWEKKFISQEGSKELVEKKVRRSASFAGTAMENFFGIVERDIKKMLQPKSTIYLNYFTDKHTVSYFFGGVGQEIVGTSYITVLSMLFAFPLGLVTAAFLAEVKPQGKHSGIVNIVLRIIRTCINTLAGVPSIVFGLFGLAFFVLKVQPALGLSKEVSILAGAMTLSVLILPVIIRASEEAIRSVPVHYKEASLALGASKLRTFVTVTMPAALPGILTGVILSMSRAAGETAPLIFTAVAMTGITAASVFDSTQILSYGSMDLATGAREGMRLPHKQYGMVMTLILLVLLLNITAIIIRWRVSKKLRG